MSLFQSTVIEKYVRELDSTQLETAWQTFSHCFLNLSKQDNIRLSKEEQYQEGFLRDLFVDVFGYTLNPNPDYNLTTEFKNQTGSKKADGAILKDGHAIGVIELKGMNTTDMSKIEVQAFGYKNNQPKCRYVITSNFQKLRLYIDNAVEHEEFDLFTMSQDRFALLYLLLRQTSMIADLPAKIKSESLSQEEAITKQLYKDYSIFKRELFADLTTNNPDIDALILFQKSQKLLDRLLFIFFAEDSHLLPANFAKGIINEWQQLKKLKRSEPLYDQIKQYFTFLDTGYKDDHSEIFAYNGGLFRPDSLLDSVIISDEILRSHILTLSEYDFDSEVDVNILGHIFENSLSELDEVKAQLAGEVVDKSQTKRKKDGVFYTPKYITKYIVENTVGKLCDDKKIELALNEEDYQLDVTLNKSGKKRKKTDKRIAEEKEALDRLHAYRDWLLEITICDPACGSGAFLNEALNFLIAEHEYIVELETKLFGSGLAYPDIENSILENNLFGVDINEESVEIAKLSLWLRTAQPRRKLNNLNDNIQCGNSLIDDPAVAGDKAFHWQRAFPQVFAKGGFDVVIGNPPYVSRSVDDKSKKFINTNYETAQYQVELYVSFIEKGINILKSEGEISFIVPNSWLKNLRMSDCRKFILDQLNISILVPNLDNVFTEASVDTLIFIATKQNKNSKMKVMNFIDKDIYLKHLIDQTRFKKNEGFIFDVEISEEILPIINKFRSDTVDIGQIMDVTRGVNPYDSYRGQSAEIIKNRAYHSHEKLDDTFVPELKGKHISPYNYSWDNEHYISYGEWLAAPRQMKYFVGDRIVFREILGKTLVSTLIKEKFIIDRSLYIARIDEETDSEFHIEYILAMLNSKLMSFYFRYSNNEFDVLFPKIRVAEFKNLPIRKILLSNQFDFKKKVESLIILKEELFSKCDKFSKYFVSTYDIEKPSRKLENWHELSFAEFIKELTKAIKATNKIRVKEGQPLIAELNKKDEFEWMELFEFKKQEVFELQKQIKQTEQDIDQMVYKLYDLTDDEIAIIEAS